MPTSRIAVAGVSVRREQRDLETGDDEDEAVQEERDRLPHGAPGQPGVGAHDARAAAAEVQAGATVAMTPEAPSCSAGRKAA